MDHNRSSDLPPNISSAAYERYAALRPNFHEATRQVSLGAATLYGPSDDPLQLASCLFAGRNLVIARLSADAPPPLEADASIVQACMESSLHALDQFRWSSEKVDVLDAEALANKAPSWSERRSVDNVALLEDVRARVRTTLRELLLFRPRPFIDPERSLRHLLANCVEVSLRLVDCKELLETPAFQQRIRVGSRGAGTSSATITHQIFRALERRCDIQLIGGGPSDDFDVTECVMRETDEFIRRRIAFVAAKKAAKSMGLWVDLARLIGSLFSEDRAEAIGGKAVDTAIDALIDFRGIDQPDLLGQVEEAIRIGYGRARKVIEEAGRSGPAAVARAEFRALGSIARTDELVREVVGHVGAIVRQRLVELAAIPNWSLGQFAELLAERSAFGRWQVRQCLECMNRGVARFTVRRLADWKTLDPSELINGAWELVVEDSAAEGGYFRALSAPALLRETKNALGRAASQIERRDLPVAEPEPRTSSTDSPVEDEAESRELGLGLLWSAKTQRRRGQIDRYVYSSLVYYILRVFFDQPRLPELTELPDGGGKSLERHAEYEAWELYLKHRGEALFHLSEEGKVAEDDRKRKFGWVRGKLRPALHRALAEVLGDAAA